MSAALIRAFAAVLLSLCASAVAGVTGIRTIPETPTTGRDFAIEVTGSTDSAVTRLNQISSSVNGQLITVLVTVSPGGSSLGPLTASQVFNVASPGTYQVVVQWSDTSTQSIDIRTFAINVAAGTDALPQQRALTGLWWAPDEPGWALALTQAPSGRLFALWFTYAPASGAGATAVPQSAATWYMLPAGNWVTPTAFSGLLYGAVGTPANLAYNPAAFAVNRVGSATIRVLSPERIEFEAEAANGVAKRKTLQRFVF